MLLLTVGGLQREERHMPAAHAAPLLEQVMCTCNMMSHMLVVLYHDTQLQKYRLLHMFNVCASGRALRTTSAVLCQIVQAFWIIDLQMTYLHIPSSFCL